MSMGIEAAQKVQYVVGQLRRAEVVVSCHHLYSKKNTGLICISQLFGASQFWCFIADIETFG
jgi:hypothetical protein